ncbi:endonuclease VII domain-containing protein [Streptomyces stelliscabiei]|uniref:Phage FluMu protein Com n=1 Tax=Streptomyces stelliscabiei TaxID=146820 RepID=A0A8I0P2Y8_9ACTN|nr:endonuclease VII domain-containing protein [Streptomyces stelliscabiei]MBE1597235.1 phage FluMu protein Com [Streptomyces stelliscabiei]
MKRCPDCGETKPLNAFYSSQSHTSTTKTSAHCRECSRRRNREYRARNAEAITARRRAARQTPEGLRKSRDRDLRRHYGISLVDLERMIHAQENRCGICSDEFTSHKQTHVDHCHRTGSIRGILCATCNLMLGHAKDDQQRLLAAAQYLEPPSW